MPPLYLDFAPGRRRFAAWLLLALALGLAVDAGLSYRELRQRAAAVDASPAASPAAARPGSEPRDIEGARQVKAHLALPWAELFAAIENAAAKSRSVLLRAIEPDPARGSLRLAGEAERYEDVLEFMRQVGAGRHLAGVHLVEHRLEAANAGGRHVFVLAARWRAAP